MDSPLLSVLPNLSIGVVAVLALAWTAYKHQNAIKELQQTFLNSMDERSDKHEKAMKEREEALRNVETSVRSTIISHLTQATVALQDNARVMGRVIRHLDGTH